MRLSEAQKLYREEKERADAKREALMAPIMRDAKALYEQEMESRRPRGGRPRKFVVEKSDPLEIPGRFRRG